MDNLFFYEDDSLENDELPEDTIDDMLENDEVDPFEAAFMRGYAET